MSASCASPRCGRTEQAGGRGRAKGESTAGPPTDRGRSTMRTSAGQARIRARVIPRHRGPDMKLLGAALIVIGFAALIAGGIPYHKREHVAQLGDLKMEVTEKRKLEIPPV